MGLSQPSSTWPAPPLLVPPCHTKTLFWGLQKSPPVGTLPPTPPPLAMLLCPLHPVLGTGHNTGYRVDYAWPLGAGHSHTCPSDPDHLHYPSRAAKPGRGEENPTLVLLLTEVMQSSLGLCWSGGGTFWLFPAFLVSSSGPLVLPLRLLGLLPSFPNFINVISTVLIILMVLCS